jgi:peptidoglycan/xylan/chitin deacetylase (PgdA/CDA1 family)
LGAERLAAVSVDLDTLPHYCRIQGLDESILDDRARALVSRVAIDRYLELFDGRPATFFAIGQDLAEPAMAAALKRSHDARVEIASHSHAHDYRLSRRSASEIADDLKAADAAIEAAVGARPVGFRAPGYTLSPALLQAVAAQGYRYDSSAFPAAPYYSAKALVMGALSVLGRPSKALLDTPRVLFAPRVPYRPDLLAPYSLGTAPLIELPIAVAPRSRLHFIGTFVTSLPWALVKATYRALKHDRLLNFELHAIDVLDESDGVPAALSRQQRDLKVPAREKLRRLKEVFGWLWSDGEPVTLAEASKRLETSL